MALINRFGKVIKLIENFSIKRFYRVTTSLMNEKSNPLVSNSISYDQISDENKMKLDSGEIKKRLMQFFDLPDNWNKEEVKSGRSWRKDELRIKSNSDLHKLWYILYKERNMLLTMQQAAKDQVDNMPSPERIDKVEESMKNIEEVIKERNRAYWKLEVGDDDFVERQKVFRKDIFGRWRWISCSQHLIPYWMNTGWRKMNAPGFGPHVVDFNRRLREKKMDMKMSKQLKQEYFCRQLMKRFPDLDLDYLKEKFPHVDVEYMKNNLNEYVKKDRIRSFNSIFYHKRKHL